MNPGGFLVAAGAITMLLVLAALVLLQRIQVQQRLARRMQMSQGHTPAPVLTGKQILREIWSRSITAIGQAILRTGLLSARTRAELEHTLASTGLRGQTGLEVFMGSKISLLVALPILAGLATRHMSLPPFLSVLIPVTAGVLGMLLPDIVVRHRRKRYIQRVEAGLPDALDLLVICSQAGLGLTAAIQRVADEMRHGNQSIGLELALTANELQFIAESRLALTNLGTRTGVDGLVRLGTTLIQSMKYGTPMTASMRMLSAEMRQDTLTRFEGKAARLGVLLTVPMIVFILPCLFLVVGGPAIVQAMRVGQ